MPSSAREICGRNTAVTEQVYHFEVEISSHAWLKRGVVAAGLVYVEVVARNPQEGELLALQMAHAAGMATSIRPVQPPP